MAKNKKTATAPKKTTPNANTSTGDTSQGVVGAGTVETNTNPARVASDAAQGETGGAPDKAPEEPKVSDALVKIGKSILKSNPAMSVVYMASDGRGFYEQNDADNHARTLKNKTVTPVKK